MRPLPLVLALLVVAGCGDARQDADEPSGELRVSVVDASFPRVQHVAEDVELKLRVRNGEPDRSLDTVAVTVQTKPRGGGDLDSSLAFGQNVRGAGLASAGRPVWVLDEGPKGGETAYVNTWLAGTLKPGGEHELVWRLVPVEPGTYDLSYRVEPGLTGRARAARGDTSGSFTVVMRDQPVPARVGDDGTVERGVEAGSGD